MEQNGEPYIPPLPGKGFSESYWTKIPYDSEILQSFVELTNIARASITFHSFDSYEDDLNKVAHHIQVGKFKCFLNHHEQCVPPNYYTPWYIWTKEGFEIQIKSYEMRTLSQFPYFDPFP